MRRFRRGVTLSELVVVFSIITLLGSILIPVLIRARVRARRVQCMANCRQLAQLAITYANDHDGRLPDAETVWTDLDAPPEMMRCPADPDNPHPYGYNRWVAGALMTALRTPSDVVLFADGDVPSRSLVSWTDIAYRHKGGALYTHADGHVQYSYGPRSIAYAATDMQQALCGFPPVYVTASDDSPVSAPAMRVALPAGTYTAASPFPPGFAALGFRAWTCAFYLKLHAEASSYAHTLNILAGDGKPIVRMVYGDHDGDFGVSWNTQPLLPTVPWAVPHAHTERDAYFADWRQVRVTVIEGDAMLELGESGVVLEGERPRGETPILYDLSSPAPDGSDYTDWASPDWETPAQFVTTWDVTDCSVDAAYADLRVGGLQLE